MSIYFFNTDYTRKSSVDSAGGSSLFDRSKYTSSSVGSSPGSSTTSECSDSDVQSLYSDDDCQEVVRQILQHEHPIRIVIKLHVTENKFTK